MTAENQVSESVTEALTKAQIPSGNHEVRPGTSRSLDKRREGAFCPCGMQLSLTGACVNCD